MVIFVVKQMNRFLVIFCFIYKKKNKMLFNRLYNFRQYLDIGKEFWGKGMVFYD